MRAGRLLLCGLRRRFLIVEIGTDRLWPIGHPYWTRAAANRAARRLERRGVLLRVHERCAS